MYCTYYFSHWPTKLIIQCAPVFRTKDAAELDDIASSVAGEIDRPTFDRVYGAAIGDGEGHPFLLVDFAKRPTHASIFRRRLNEFIVL